MAMIMEQDMTRFRREIEYTQDGSTTLYMPEIDEHYHSTHGAVIEARHVYIKEALEKRLSLSPDSFSLSVLEVGFGTGLNALLTFLWAEKYHIKIHYTTLELYPLSIDIIRQINFPLVMESDCTPQYEAMHLACWNRPCPLSDFFVLDKRNMDLVNDKLEGRFDVVYFDAFAPDKQPEMWQDSIYRKVYDSLNESAVLSTYCSKGVVRRGLQQVGFQMERIPGPPGKREMLRGIKKG
jgi:Uncharacterized conserved protein